MMNPEMNYDMSAGAARLNVPPSISPLLRDVMPREKKKSGVRRLRIARGADLGALRTLLAGMTRVEVVLAGGTRVRVARGVDEAVLQALVRRPDVVRLELVMRSS
jgi:hypothetical protein